MQVKTETSIKNETGQDFEFINEKSSLMTKNKGTYYAEFAAEQEIGYEKWAKTKVEKSMQQLKKNGSQGIMSDELEKRIFKELKN